MAETLLSFGVEKLWDLLVRESERLQGVDGKFNWLKRDLNLLRCFLEDADAKKHTSAMVRNTVKEIKEIVLDAEDIIETFLLEKELGKTNSIRKRVKRFPRVIVKRRRLASDMETISKRISMVISDMQNLGVQKVIGKKKYTHSIEERQRRMRQTFSSDNEDHLVGLEEKVHQLVGYLVEEDCTSRVVSITGMGGIGKTTLARQVFNHETVQCHFEGLAWVSVSQDFTREHVWRTILQKLRPECKVLKMMDEQVQEKLFQVLETQKVLVVLDDIWREEDWDMITEMFPRRKGWKILLTSRNEGVALRADPKCFTFKPECLTDEESWTLFRRIAFRNITENEVDEEMEEMGKKMIEHCGGLPLAVKVLGGLLAPQYTLSDWKKVNENIGSRISSVYNILYLSYEELPIYLKYCFLYLAHFPEDYEIDVERLSYYWAAEGIPRPMFYDGAGIRDVGDGYIDELVKRNMVISNRNGITSRFETCQLHDMMREVCLLKAKEENLVQIVDASTRQLQAPASSASSQSRRLVIPSRDHTFSIKNPKLRSLLRLRHSRLMASDLCFRRLQLMRVLDLSFVKFEGEKLPSSIGKLIHLRYLCLYMANVTHLPSSIQKLKLLLYLNLCVLGEVYMPNFLKEMRELRYLYLPERLHDKVKLEMFNLVKLETLENFSTEHGSVGDLQDMTRLETLSIISSGGCSVEKLSSSLSQLKRLENLAITERDETRTREFVLDCVHLRQLELTIYMPRLPDEQNLPSRLSTLSLYNCHLEEDPMPILEKLLHLKEIKLLRRSFCGRRMVCSTDGFPRLQNLVLWELKELEEWIVELGSMPLLRKLQVGYCEKLEEWIVEEDSMPLLHILNITHCDKLTEFPDGLQFITSLKKLSVHLRGQEWKNRLSEGFLPSRFTTLSLHDCRLEEDPMPTLEKLLHLKEVKLSYRSFCGRRMVCSRGGFPQLQKLQFDGLEELEEWIVEEGSMPLLHTLQIGNCKKLKEFPDGLQFIASLKDVSVLLRGEEWKNILSGGDLPSRLTNLSLLECRLEEDPMPILEKLLHLKEVMLLMPFFCGRRMVCSTDGFPQLQNLEIRRLEELEEWIVEESSMPLLHSLSISGSYKLKELPDGLQFITSLKFLTLDDMGKEWKKRLSEGGEDYYKVQHIPSVECDGIQLRTTRK